MADMLRRQDYEHVAAALRAAAARIGEELTPTGVLTSLDPAAADRVLAVVADTMAEHFAAQHLVFNRDAFLNAAGLRAAVDALHQPERRRVVGGPVAFEDVRRRDTILYRSSGGARYVGEVAKVTAKTVTIAAGSRDFDHGYQTASPTSLRRTNWSRHHAYLLDESVETERADGAARGEPAHAAANETDAESHGGTAEVTTDVDHVSGAAQAFPQPPRPGGSAGVAVHGSGSTAGSMPRQSHGRPPRGR